MRIGKVRRAIGVDEALRHHWCEAGVVMVVSRVAHSGRQGLTAFPIYGFDSASVSWHL